MQRGCWTTEEAEQTSPNEQYYLLALSDSEPYITHNHEIALEEDIQQVDSNTIKYHRVISQTFRVVIDYLMNPSEPV